jgi:hypothetical protein
MSDLPRYRLSVYGSAVTKIDVFQSQDDMYAVAEAHNMLKTRDYVFLENATLERHLDPPNDPKELSQVATFRFSQHTWNLTSRG